MASLSRIAAVPEVTAVVEAQAVATCAAGGTVKTWPNHATAKRLNGSWDYPNRATAKRANGSWDYPTRKSAKHANGSWSYPDGKTARRGEDRWIRPDARSATLPELVSWACGVLGAEECSRLTTVIEKASGDERDAAIVELAWRARKTG
jgi:hypothetical protein